MKQIITALTMIVALSTHAQGTFAPTKEQISNVQKIKELQRTNKGGKNKAQITKLINANIAIEKKKIEVQKSKQIKK